MTLSRMRGLQICYATRVQAQRRPLFGGAFFLPLRGMATLRQDWQRLKKSLDSRLNPHWWQCPRCFWSDTFRAIMRQVNCPDCGSNLRNLDSLYGTLVRL